MSTHTAVQRSADPADIKRAKDLALKIMPDSAKLYELHNAISKLAPIFRTQDELVKAARKALNYITNTEGELGITLDSGNALRAALSLATQPNTGEGK